MRAPPFLLTFALPSLLQDYVLRVCASIESLRIPFDANAFRESQKEKDLRIETVNGEGGVRVAKKFIFSSF